MQQIIRQLEQVRSHARGWLVVLHLSRFLGALVLVLTALVCVDWLLDLPGWLRLVIGLLVVVESVYWLGTRLIRAMSFRPSLSDLALRAERLYPQLEGVFASTVEFEANEQPPSRESPPPYHRAIVDRMVRQVMARLEGVDLSRLINHHVVARELVGSVLIVACVSVLILLEPGISRTAAMRWLAPLGSAQWPKSVDVQDVTGLTVWPVDTPIQLRSRITRGHRPDMRVRVHYRIVDLTGQAGPWTQAVMTAQTTTAQAGEPVVYERLLDVPPTAVRLLDASPQEACLLEYRFEAGDAETPRNRISLVSRPRIESVQAHIEPPVYATGLVDAQTLALHEQPGSLATAKALVGSAIRLEVTLNKPVPLSEDLLHTIMPGLSDDVEPGKLLLSLSPLSAQQEEAETNEQTAKRFDVSFSLPGTVNTGFTVKDEHGLASLSQRLYRIEAVQDSPPSVAITLPETDEAVLATAQVDINATAQDDVGLEHLLVTGSISKSRKVNGTERQEMQALARRDGRQPTLQAAALLDLSTYDLSAGDTITLYAVAQDVFELEGKRHDPVQSAPRTLRIIDEPTLVSQIRTELAGLRQQVVRLEQTQQRIQSEHPPSVTIPQQEQITQRLDAQTALLDRLTARMQRNRLESPDTLKLIDSAEALVDQAREYSIDATDKLRQADAKQNTPEAEPLENEARSRQDAVRQTLSELADLLDQGRDVLTLKLQLQQLRTQQQALANDTRELLPQTIGQSRDQLDEADRQRLDELEQRQRDLEEQARSLTRQMQLTADALSRQGERDQDRAAAEALAEAAAIGQRQGLQDAMDRSSQSLQQNQLSQAGQEQDRALNTLERMLQEIDTREQRRQAILQRRVRELVSLVRQLIQRQTNHAERVRDSEPLALSELEPEQVTIRRATMGAQQQADASSETAKAGEHLADAVREQGQAVLSLRNAAGAEAFASETGAIEQLEQALEVLESLEKDAQTQEAIRQREALRQAYLKLADEQDALRESVEETRQAGAVGRRQRAALIGLSADQSRLQQAIADAGRQVEETLVFVRMHERMGAASSRVVSALRRGEAGPVVTDEQAMIAATLRAMAEALKQDPNNSDFASGGGGGGGQGEGQPPPMVPPLAELKLIRGLQQVIYDQTKTVQAATAGQPDQPTKQKLMELSTRQRELSDLGQRLIEQVRQQSRPTPDTGAIQ
ncbi:MAG: hypothetical protein Kow00105_09970 [Phycisphaeraceae bacterium]